MYAAAGGHAGSMRPGFGSAALASFFLTPGAVLAAGGVYAYNAVTGGSAAPPATTNGRPAPAPAASGGYNYTTASAPTYIASSPYPQTLAPQGVQGPQVQLTDSADGLSVPQVASAALLVAAAAGALWWAFKG